ncbi:MAG: YegP family protein [Planctomycetota bacterium]|nr:YegP family protein [Planctomycetota bacterium]
MLKAKNRQVVGTGQAYSGSTVVRHGTKSVIKNAPKAQIEDDR